MLRNTLERAEKAKKKKAALGSDVEIEEFEGEEAGEHEEVESLSDLSNKDQKSLLKVGVDPSGAGRAGSFLQIDQSKVCSNCQSEAIELMGLPQALEKYDWGVDRITLAIGA